MAPITEKLLTPEEYEVLIERTDEKIKKVRESRELEEKNLKAERRAFAKLKSKSLRAQNAKLCQELGERVVKVLGRPPVREDLDRLENFLRGQEKRGNCFSSAMSGKLQETELSTLSTLKNGLRSL